jgi:hypothetical protein
LFRTVGGRVQIDKKNAFCELYRQFPIRENDSITTKIFKEWDPHISGLEPSVTREALSNCHGDWYEWILAIASWNARVITLGHRHALLLPNIAQFDVNTLYTEDVLTIIEDIKTKVEESADVNFITSNPDLLF